MARVPSTRCTPPCAGLWASNNVVTTKSKRELDLMDRADTIVLTVLEELRQMAAPGVTTGELDAHAENRILEMGARPAFKGYRGYPYTLCVSINEQIVHGMPSDRTLKSGDIVGLDLGAIVEGYYGDSAITVPIGEVAPDAMKLLDATSESLRRAIGAVQAGGRVSDISAAIQTYVEELGYSVVRDFVGHGIGTQLHEDPQVPNYVDRGRGNRRLKEGMVLAIEPMVNVGTWRATIADDGWTASTADGSLSAHFERSVAVTANGPWVLGEKASGVTL